MTSEQEWIDALGSESKRDFALRAFEKSPAMVRREPVYGPGCGRNLMRRYLMNRIMNWCRICGITSIAGSAA